MTTSLSNDKSDSAFLLGVFTKDAYENNRSTGAEDDNGVLYLIKAFFIILYFTSIL